MYTYYILRHREESTTRAAIELYQKCIDLSNGDCKDILYCRDNKVNGRLQLELWILRRIEESEVHWYHEHSDYPVFYTAGNENLLASEFKRFCGWDYAETDQLIQHHESEDIDLNFDVNDYLNYDEHDIDLFCYEQGDLWLDLNE